MSPSGHSRSSHSSSHSSHSSSRSSSRSHSSSSRSHSSSHSSSSHSSSYRANRFMSYGGSSSASSGSSTYRQPLRTRTHQPTNYRFGSTHPTFTYQCRRHDYVFYPVSWLDESTNTTFQKGYYDEQGNRYDNLIIKNNEKYENVPMHCEYCGTSQVRDLTDDSETMTCPHCGANMIIDAILDERADVAANNAYNAAGAGTPVSSRSKWRPFIIMAAIFGGMYLLPVITSTLFAPLLGFNKLIKSVQNMQNPTVQQSTVQPGTTTQPVTSTSGYISSNVDIFGTELYLKSGGNGMLISNSSNYDKNLVWSDYDESYYDASSDCYVWFNTDMDPALWQYWYEGISSYYGDYGWMEYEDGNWYIEKDSGNWVEIDLSGYGDRIWHFEDAHGSGFWEN